MTSPWQSTRLMTSKFTLEETCVGGRIKPAEFDELYGRARQVTFETFRRRCDIGPVAAALGYAVGSGPGLRLSTDPYVTFYRSRFRGAVCYYMDWSAIDHVFTESRRGKLRCAVGN